MQTLKKSLIFIIPVLLIATYILYQKNQPMIIPEINTAQETSNDSQLSEENKNDKIDLTQEELIVIESTAESVGSIEDKGLDFNYDITIEGVKTFLSCGYEGCFEDYFKECKPAIAYSDAGLFKVSNEILGFGDYGCKVKTLYDRYVSDDSDWNDKPLVCEFNADKELDVQTMGIYESGGIEKYHCTGELVDVLREIF